MELSLLAAWVDVLGKLRQKAGIEFPPRELARKDFRVYARDRGTQPPIHHLLRELIGIATLKWKKRFDTGVLEKALAVASHILQKQIAERHARHALLPGLVDGIPECGFVVSVRARMRDADNPKLYPG